MDKNIKDMSPAEAREIFLSAIGVRDWTWQRLFGRPMLVLAAATLIQLYGVLHSRWTLLELMLLYAAEIVSFAFWYGMRATLMQGNISVLLFPTAISAVAIGFVAMFLGVLGEYDLRAGASAAALPALILFTVYGAQCYHAWRSGLDRYDERNVLRLTIIIAIYINAGIFTILACVIADKGFHLQAGGMAVLIAVRFVIEALLRTRLEFE